jgi:hypothetical protein
MLGGGGGDPQTPGVPPPPHVSGDVHVPHDAPHFGSGPHERPVQSGVHPFGAQTFATARPHVKLGGHAPQSIGWPHPSSIVPQSLPCTMQLFGVHIAPSGAIHASAVHASLTDASRSDASGDDASVAASGGALVASFGDASGSETIGASIGASGAVFDASPRGTEPSAIGAVASVALAADDAGVPSLDEQATTVPVAIAIAAGKTK